ncbi:MAG: hypothetical protein ACP5Q4_09235 [Candidatus Caldatribacteriaceae bacterium]
MGSQRPDEIEALKRDNSLTLFERAFLSEFSGEKPRGLRAIRELHRMYIESQRYMVERAQEEGVPIVTFFGLVPNHEELDALLNDEPNATAGGEA